MEHKTKNLNIGIVKIETKSFSMTSAALNYNRIEPVDIEFGLSFTTPDVNKLILFTIDVNIFAGSQDKPKLANLRVVSHFRVANVDDFLHPADQPGGAQKVEGALIQFCLDVSISHARGILSVKIEDTPLEDIILPLVPPGHLMSQLQIQTMETATPTS